MICKYCKDVKKLLDIGYDPDVKRIVSQIQYQGVYWSRHVEVPLNYCPACGAKIKNENEEDKILSGVTA